MKKAYNKSGKVSKAESKEEIMRIILELEDDFGRTIALEDIWRLAKEKGLTKAETNEIMEGLKRSGEIYEPREEFISRTNRVKPLSFKEAEKLVKQRRTAADRTVCFRQGVGNVTIRDLPYVDDAYRFGSSATVALLDNFDNLLSIKTAKRLSAIINALSYDEFNALLKKEAPELYSSYNGRLTYTALRTLIDFRAGKLLEFGELIDNDKVIARLEKKVLENEK